MDAPPPRRRKWISVAMGLFLATQVAVPLSYYLYKEPTDERFAWRMFSSVHMSDWSRMRIVERHYRGGSVLEQVVPVKDMLVESTWSGLYTCQRDIRDKFLHVYLDGSGADELRYETQGIWPSGRPMEPVKLVIQRGDSVLRTAP